jgi:hypothetical protein
VIARIWRGWTTRVTADAYQEIVSQEVLPGIAARNLDGYHGAYLLRRRLDDELGSCRSVAVAACTQG